jgi:hypothetical protein
MSIRSREEAINALKLRSDVLVGIVHEAMVEFYAKCGSFSFILEGWTKASVIRDLTKDKLQRFADMDPGLQLVRRGNATSLRIDDAFLTRIKKLDDKKRARVSRTRASWRFDRNNGSGQASFDFNDRPLTTSYLGYVPNENNLLSPSVFFVVNNEVGKHAWEPIELMRAVSEETELSPNAQSEEQETGTRARVKKSIQDKRAENG